MHRAYQFGNDDGRRNGSGTNADLVEVSAPQQVEIEFETLVLEIERSRVSQHGLAGSRKGYAIRVAAKQLQTQIVFNRLNASTEGRWTEMNACRGS